jgi:hypothetical protein
MRGEGSPVKDARGMYPVRKGDMTARSLSVTERIEASIAKMQAELEDAEGERKDALEWLIEQARHLLIIRLKRHVLH